ncbi:hypothetical protein [Chengkuizengella axinellae]|uniref:Uncharacterized protein n=1 Tax=Chengkuizengella axinellae TaxID=3064388 RepID=A0ABT9J025_9BACL|nr:hypothetical protein [Chengkuizengella sp. 2205SS18-9]MDP5274379.1 hypothetical protein [Chengkuizengella sp. 2205SS18-9]
MAEKKVIVEKVDIDKIIIAGNYPDVTKAIILEKIKEINQSPYTKKVE